MNIAIVSSGGYGFEYEDYSNRNLLGLEAQLFGLSRDLATKGHDVHIFRRWRQTGEEELDGVKIVSLKSLGAIRPVLLTLSKLRFSWRLRSELRTVRPDVLVLVDPYTAFFLMSSTAPRVTITHSAIPYDMIRKSRPYEGPMNRLYEIVNRITLRRLFSRSDLVIALNDDLRRHLESKGYRTVCIPNGIDLSKYQNDSRDGKYVLFGGRLVKEKGVDSLIKAYSRLDKELANEYPLVIMGFGKEENHLRKLTRQLGIEGNVRFVAWQASTKFIEAISKCSVFVLPSLYETFGIVVIEAMALGKPVIASRIPGPKNIINHNEDGLLFDSGDSNQLRDCLRLLLENENLRKSIGRKARLKAQSLFDFDVVADQFLREFEGLIEERRCQKG